MEKKVELLRTRNGPIEVRLECLEVVVVKPRGLREIGQAGMERGSPVSL
jgi:hypothetical protein